MSLLEEEALIECLLPHLPTSKSDAQYSCSTSCGFKLFNVLMDCDILRNLTKN